MGAAARLIWDFRYDLKLEHRLPRLGVPALVVAGGDDRIVPAEHPARWAELLGADVATVPGGHAFPVQRPDETAALITSFVSGSPMANRLQFHVFHLMPYPFIPPGEELESTWVTLPNTYFEPQVAHRLYTQNLDQLVACERLGFDGIIVNEHHQNAFGTINAPNVW